jgi:hypothetical protein
MFVLKRSSLQMPFSASTLIDMDMCAPILQYQFYML